MKSQTVQSKVLANLPMKLTGRFASRSLSAER